MAVEINKYVFVFLPARVKLYIGIYDYGAPKARYPATMTSKKSGFGRGMAARATVGDKHHICVSNNCG